MTKIKICGITNVQDARSAIKSGADYVGLIFAPSRRCVIKGAAKMIMDECADFVNWVGVFMNGKKKVIEEFIGGLPIKILQFHGNESPAFCNYFINRGYTVIKTLPVEEGRLLLDPALYQKADYFLLDTVFNGNAGGTGQSFDWSKIQSFGLKDIATKVFLSGGLSPENVRGAIAQVRPFGVDASSKLEKTPGLKDHALVTSFINAVRCEGNNDN